MKPICVQCERFFKPDKNGVYFTENRPAHNGAQPGPADPQAWLPYKIWCGDKWKCPSCGATIIVGVGLQPVSEHYKPDFKELSQSLGAADLQINDC